MLGFQNYVCATNYLCFSVSAEQPLLIAASLSKVTLAFVLLSESAEWAACEEVKMSVRFTERRRTWGSSARGAGSQPCLCSSSLELLFFPGACVPSQAGVTTLLLLPLARSFYFLLSALGLAELSWPEESETWESVRAGKCGSSSVFCFVLPLL